MGIKKFSWNSLDGSQYVILELADGSDGNIEAVMRQSAESFSAALAGDETVTGSSTRDRDSFVVTLGMSHIEVEPILSVGDYLFLLDEDEEWLRVLTGPRYMPTGFSMLRRVPDNGDVVDAESYPSLADKAIYGAAFSSRYYTLPAGTDSDQKIPDSQVPVYHARTSLYPDGVAVGELVRTVGTKEQGLTQARGRYEVYGNGAKFFWDGAAESVSYQPDRMGWCLGHQDCVQKYEGANELNLFSGEQEAELFDKIPGKETETSPSGRLVLRHVSEAITDTGGNEGRTTNTYEVSSTVSGRVILAFDSTFDWEYHGLDAKFTFSEDETSILRNGEAHKDLPSDEIVAAAEADVPESSYSRYRDMTLAGLHFWRHDHPHPDLPRKKLTDDPEVIEDTAAPAGSGGCAGVLAVMAFGLFVALLSVA